MFPKTTKFVFLLALFNFALSAIAQDQEIEEDPLAAAQMVSRNAKR